MNNPGIMNILKYLKSEEERFLKAGNSGMFCDSENCLNTAQAIRWGIWDLEESMNTLGFNKEE